MHITLLTSSIFSQSGASENFVRLLSTGIAKNGVNIDIVRFYGKERSNYYKIKCSSYFLPFHSRCFIIKFFEVALQILYIPFFLFRQKFLKRNIILLYGIDRSYFILPMLCFCKLLNIKCFRIISEIYLRSEGDCKVYTINTYFENIQLRYIDKYLDGIIVLSKFLYDTSIKFSVKKENLLIIPNLISFDKETALSFNSNIFRICYCGSISFENGIYDLFKAFEYLNKKIENLELHIIGYMNNKIFDKLKNEKLISKNVYIKGGLTRNEIINEYPKYDVLVNPKKKSILAESGFPFKLGEYFSTKIPVVTSRVGDSIYYFTDKKEVVFSDPDNFISIANAIEYLYNNKDKKRQIGLNGYEWAMENLDYLKNCSKIMTFIKTNS